MVERLKDKVALVQRGFGIDLYTEQSGAVSLYA